MRKQEMICEVWWDSHCGGYIMPEELDGDGRNERDS